jgi:hypothetical protein
MFANMTATARSIAIMIFVPPLLLLCWAHFIRPTISGSGYFAVFLAAIFGIAGVATAPWSAKAKVVVAILYIGLAVATLPWMTLLAVCSTGDCL